MPEDTSSSKSFDTDFNLPIFPWNLWHSHGATDRANTEATINDASRANEERFTRPISALMTPAGTVSSLLIGQAKHNDATLASVRKSIDLRHADSRRTTPEKNTDSVHRAYPWRLCDRDGIRRKRNGSDRRAAA